MKKLKGIMTLLTAVILMGAFALSFMACDNGGDPPPQTATPQSVTYVSTDSEGNLYTLEIIENLQGRSARYAAKSGDSFKFTVELFNNGNYTVALTYSGTIDSAEGSGTDIELRITVNGEVLDITISGSNMTVISGNIVDEDGDPLDILDTTTLTPVADKTLLGSAITTANTAKQGVVVSVNGQDIEKTVYWVTQTQMDSFNSAIATAQAFYNDGEADQSMINSARITLVAATTVFNGQKQLGTKMEQQQTEYDVYVAGSYNNGTINIPCYWKNGVKTDLSFTGYNDGGAEKIVIDGNDIYVQGWVGESFGDGGGRQIGCYWKNGTITVVDGWATDMAVSNGDVYLVGQRDVFYIDGYMPYPCYWKNGTRIDLDLGSNFNGYASKISISENTVYIGGVIQIEPYIGPSTPCFWQNGVLTSLNMPENILTGIFANGNDLYIIGGGNFGWYWKNNNVTNLQLNSSVWGIAVNGNDLYLAGSVGEYQNRKAHYWKNGQSFILTGGSIDKESYANAITVTGEDVFIAGSVDNFFNFDGETFTSGSTACYWKNGALNVLSENASANSIFVVVSN